MRAKMTTLTALLRRYPLPWVATIGLVAGVVAGYVAHQGDLSNGILLATLVVGGLPVVWQTATGALHGKFASDIIATLAILGAAITGEYFAGCVIVLMQTGGEALEDFAVRRASASLQALAARAPRTAHRRLNGRLETVPATEIRPGEVVVVRPGELVPVDGIVIAGLGFVDESALTGEPMPVTKRPESEVMSGSICLDSSLELRAIRASSESQYEQIVRLVGEAQEDKAPLGRLADRYAVFFTPLTILMCGAAYAITHRAEAVVAVLVVATPCPLILATPVAIISGINRAARRQIIVKGGTAIERIGQAGAVIFDKTGTLTAGTPVVQQVVALDGYSAGEVLRLAAGLEQHSSHPMARALVTAGRNASQTLPTPESMQESDGQGVSGRVEGHLVEVGSLAFAQQRGLATAERLQQARGTAGAHQAAVAVIGIDGQATGLVVYGDAVRRGAAGLVQRLAGLGVREVVMLTGDDRVSAQAVADEVGISHVHAELLPAQKVEEVRECFSRHQTVVMVGDGINDAPALATATVGVALAARGTAIAAEAADIVITTDDLERVADAVEIGRRTIRIARQSIWAGIGLSGAMMAIAALGFIPPAIGALLQEGVDTAVILNALRAR